MNLEQLKKYVYYSNVYITLGLNPFHWTWIPRCCRYYATEWPAGPNEREYRALWLGVLVKVIIDNGDW